jgi:hypothetical protein
VHTTYQLHAVSDTLCQGAGQAVVNKMGDASLNQFQGCWTRQRPMLGCAIKLCLQALATSPR